MQNSPSNDLLFPSRGGFCTIRPSRARMVELVDTRDLKSRGPGRVRAGSSPAPGTTIFSLISAAHGAGKISTTTGSLRNRTALNASQIFLNEPASFAVDPANDEIYIAD